MATERSSGGDCANKERIEMNTIGDEIMQPTTNQEAMNLIVVRAQVAGNEAKRRGILRTDLGHPS